MAASRSSLFAFLVILTLCGWINFCNGSFYLPGVVPRQFAYGEDVGMTVNKLTSIHTQLPFQYYHLPVCKPEKIVNKAENLGELLSGDRIENSLYELKMKQNARCKILCKMSYGVEDILTFKKMIYDEYKAHWIIDNLPATMKMTDPMNKGMEHYEASFPVGFSVPISQEEHEIVKNGDENMDTKKHHKKLKLEEKNYYLYNHIKFTLLYHENADLFQGARVVGFFVEPYSIKHHYTGRWPPQKLDTCNDEKSVKSTDTPQQISQPDDVVWTYDVYWESSNIPWASRWDVFLKPPPDAQIHWFSIINSLMIVLFLTGMVAMIMMRTLHKDISKYNEFSEEEAAEETGWKLVHGDVFRPPRHPLILAVFCGTGVQILAMTLTIMMFTLLGFLSPAKRGGLATAMLLMFVLMGFPAGYVSARLYKMFGLKNWKQCTFVTATFYPGLVFGLFFVVDLVEWANASSGAVPFSTMVALLILWCGISVPLCALGSYRGFQRETISNPTRYNHIPRQIPPQPMYMHAIVSILVGGILPFGAVFIELFFIMSSIWLHQIYYLFGFLFLVLVILIATCAEITIVMCYFQLCAEDYNWWWRSFLTSGASAFYLYMYSIMYFATKLDMTKFVAGMLYFVYMFVIALSFFLLTGMIGFFACFWFVRQIYGAIKID